MLLFEILAARAEAIASIGVEVRAEAAATGTSVSYTEPAYGTRVIREWPAEGRREIQTPEGWVPLPPRG